MTHYVFITEDDFAFDFHIAVHSKETLKDAWKEWFDIEAKVQFPVKVYVLTEDAFKRRKLGFSASMFEHETPVEVITSKRGPGIGPSKKPAPKKMAKKPDPKTEPRTGTPPLMSYAYIPKDYKGTWVLFRKAANPVEGFLSLPYTTIIKAGSNPVEVFELTKDDLKVQESEGCLRVSRFEGRPSVKTIVTPEGGVKPKDNTPLKEEQKTVVAPVTKEEKVYGLVTQRMLDSNRLIDVGGGMSLEKALSYMDPLVEGDCPANLYELTPEVRTKMGYITPKVVKDLPVLKTFTYPYLYGVYAVPELNKFFKGDSHQEVLAELLKTNPEGKFTVQELSKEEYRAYIGFWGYTPLEAKDCYKGLTHRPSEVREKLRPSEERALMPDSSRVSLTVRVKSDLKEIALRTGVKHVRSQAQRIITDFWTKKNTPAKKHQETEEDYRSRLKTASEATATFFNSEMGQGLLAYMVGGAWALFGDDMLEHAPSEHKGDISHYGDLVAHELRVAGGTDLLDGVLTEIVGPVIADLSETKEKLSPTKVRVVTTTTTDITMETEDTTERRKSDLVAKKT